MLHHITVDNKGNAVSPVSIFYPFICLFVNLFWLEGLLIKGCCLDVTEKLLLNEIKYF